MVMKSILATGLFLLIGFISLAQQPIVHRHTHSWAGGVCCSHGVDYTLTIKIPKGDWNLLIRCWFARVLNSVIMVLIN